MWRLLCALGLCAGCYHANPAEDVPCTPELTCPDGQFCDTGHSPPICVFQLPDAAMMRIDAAIDAPPIGCVTSADCTQATAAVCDQTTMTCRGCLQDSECGSHVCVESTATCVAATNALFVSPSGIDINSCTTEASPCLTITGALNKLSAARRTIRVADGTYSESWVFATSAAVVISGTTPSAANTTINFAVGGFGGGATHDHCVESTGTPLTLEGMTFAGATAEGLRFVSTASKATVFGVIVQTSAGGIDCNNCDVTIVHSGVINNTTGSGIGVAANGATPIVKIEESAIGGNSGVGLALGTATFSVTNSFIAVNGGGGVTIGTPGNGSRFDFNTVVGNTGLAVPTGMRCTVTTPISNSIFSGNGAVPQITDTCQATYSLFDDATGQPNMGDKLGNPQFMSATDLHIKATSAARNAADPTASESRDIDNEHRPQGNARDIGADEIP